MTDNEEYQTDIAMDIKGENTEDDSVVNMGADNSKYNGFGNQVEFENNEETLNSTCSTVEGTVTSVLDESIGGESLKVMGDQEEVYEYNAAEISLKVHSSELDMYLSDSDQSDHTETECPSHTEELPVNEIDSPLHCPLCGNMFTDPRMLDCLHAYCYQCIDKCSIDQKTSAKTLRCPSCGAFQIVKSFDNLPKHPVVEKLVQMNGSDMMGMHCVVCALHEEQREPTGKCVDCGDLLCDRCCEKHTFSRLTAKHVIVPLDSDSPIPKRSQYSICPQHEELCSNFCTKCSSAICKMCANEEHAGHTCISLDKKSQEIKKDIDKQMCELEEALVSMEKDATCEEDINMLDKLEEEQLNVLRNGREKYIALVEESYNAATKKLSAGYKRTKERCIHRHAFIRNRRKDVNSINKIVNFIFSEGRIEEVMQMEELVVHRIDIVKRNVKKTFHKVTSKSNLPRAEICHELYDELKAEPCFFNVGFANRKSKAPCHHDAKAVNTLCPRQYSQSKVHGDNPGKVNYGDSPLLPSNQPRVPLGRGALLMSRRNLTLGATLRSQGMEESKHPSRTAINEHFVSSQRIEESKHPSRNAVSEHFVSSHRNAHAASFRQVGNQSSNWLGSARQGSLLGDYPGPHGAMSASLSATQQRMFEAARVSVKSERNVFANFTDDQLSGYELGPVSCSGVDIDRQTILASSSDTLPDRHMTVPVFKQRFAVSVQIDSDKKMPEIGGIVFTSPENFVVSDSRNQMLKAFSGKGNFLDFIADPGPMSLTFCNGWLMWNSQFSNIKFYNTRTQEVITNPSLSQSAQHPLTSCRNQTYLVGNVNKSSIEAYTVDVPGKLVLYMVPKGYDGQVIHDVTGIATRSKNQLVVIDNYNKKVVVNDLTGRFIGEFFKEDCEPSSVCITEHDQIFVTDIYRNKIILLNAHGRFIKEWGTLVERPNAIATNGQGILAVGGAGRNVIIYEYRVN